MSESVLKRVMELRAGGNAVDRFHNVRTIRRQNNAEHSWGVAMLVMEIYPEASAALLRAALTHDISECVTGDIPAPVKWANPLLKAELNRITSEYEQRMQIRETLSGHDQAVLAFCDMTELILWSLEECKLGNTYAKLVVKRGLDALGKLLVPTERARRLIVEMVNEQSVYATGSHNHA